ncbi:MAG TPA: FkbM family methyltransferase [Caldimonas sp.]|jgi:FkbM family methyltransferase|nr:FkbM family methyltransferase [Caldimonas sp.]HEX2540224.1 FkbM family methyltransferase [Caldimonas sp.]
MTLYETIASRLVGTPLQAPAEWLRWLKGAPSRLRHPELGELYVEDRRLDEVMRRAIRPATNCVDVGCHLGTYLHKFVTLAPNGTHRAFEPVAHKAEWLRRKFPTVTVMQMALGEATGTAEYFVYEDQTAYSGLAKSKEPGVTPEARQIECRRLDDVVPQDAQVGFLKVDVNGGELGVLRGGRRVLMQDRPLVLLGCTQGGLTDYGLDSAQVHAFLVDEVGYRIYLPKDHLAGGEPLSAARFHETMQYPFQAFNYIVEPGERR